MKNIILFINGNKIKFNYKYKVNERKEIIAKFIFKKI